MFSVLGMIQFRYSTWARAQMVETAESQSCSFTLAEILLKKTPQHYPKTAYNFHGEIEEVKTSMTSLK